MEGPADAGASRKQDLINGLIARNIPIKLGTDHDWKNDYARAFNARLGDPPDVVVVPENVKHISEAVIFASDKGVKVQARSGGHSYAAFGSRKMANYTLMVVDLRNFKEIRYLNDDVLLVGGGVRLGHLAWETHRLAGHALAHGTCPSVGVGGHYTHGGYGYTSRAWGLAMDQIVGMDVVTADGRLKQASEDENGPLFWALRGAADSFGIVVRFRLKTRPAPQHSLRFSAEYPDIAADHHACTEAVMALQHVASQDSFEKEISFGVVLEPGRFGISGVMVGKMERQNTCVSRLFKALTGHRKSHTGDTMPALDTAGKLHSQRVEVLGWIDLLKDLAGGSPLVTPEPFTDSESSYANSLLVPQGFGTQALNDYFRYIRINNPAPIRWFTIINLWGGHDSEIPKSLGTACRRDAFWVVQNYGCADDGAAFPSSGLEFMKGLHQAMAKSIPGGGACANYPDLELGREQAGYAYYGSSYDKLKTLKKALDPNDVFHNAQSIGRLE